MSKLKTFEIRKQLTRWNEKRQAENDIKQWANKSAYMAAQRNAFTEYPEASERKARYGRI